MRIYRSLEETPPDFGPCALTIGNFDGVHVGHRKILRRVVETAREHGWRPSVLTFDPHPARVVAPQRAPKLMMDPAARVRLMETEGIEQGLILPFNHDTSRLSPEEFVSRILVDRLHARAVLVGDNFRFGHRQAGDVRVLEGLGRKYGFSTEIVPAIQLRGRLVSSTEIRKLVESGQVARACRLLERPYSLDGNVRPGRGVGSKQTVPTLNLETGSEVLPGRGVYITRTRDLDSARSWNSVTNIGYRPTFDGQGLSIETFLLDRLDAPAPARIAVEFLYRLRDERRFDSPADLKAQILRDVRRAQLYFQRRGRAGLQRVV